MLLLEWSVYILSITDMTISDLHYELSIMHDPWLSHCISSWSCMNWKLDPKHLYVMHAVIPHADTIYASTRSSEGPSLRDGRYVNKLSNLLSLTECGFYDHLEEDGLFYLDMGMYCRPRRPSATVIFKLSPAPKRNPQKRERSFVFLPCCSSKRCLCEAAW
jgi:hypothetical protein